MRTEFNNTNVEHDVAQVLKNIYFNTNVPVNKTIESAVKQEMIKSQEIIDNHNKVEAYSMANKEYSENGFTYTVYESGTTTAQGQVPTQGIKCGSRVTPEGMLPGDQRGHIIAAQEGGPNKPFNMTAQNGKLNQGAYKTVENTEVDLARQSYDVHTSKTAFASTQQGGRPDAYMINDTITSPDGKTHNVHLSFQNMSPEEQAEQNSILQENDFTGDYPNPDPLRESMTTDKYSDLMKETESCLPCVKDEFAMDNYSEITFDSGAIQQCEAYASSTESGVQGAGTSEGISSGTGADTGADTGCDIEM